MLKNKKKIVPNGHQSENIPIKSRGIKFPEIFTLHKLQSILPKVEEDPYTFTGISRSEHFICWPHMRTLMTKNFRQLIANRQLLLFFILLPAIEIALIMLCIGRDIDHIPIAVYNGERPNPDLSLVFLQSVPEGAFIQMDFDSPQKALNAVKENRAHALLQFSSTFSSALRARFFSFAFEESAQDSENIRYVFNNNKKMFEKNCLLKKLDLKKCHSGKPTFKKLKL